MSHLPLFRPSETVSTARLTLRAARTADVETLEWLGAAVSPEWVLDDVIAHAEADECVLIKKGAAPIGVAVAVPDAPSNGFAAVPLIAVEPAERFRGLGGEAALALERRIAERWAPVTVLAPVPEGRGLAVYFWLRAGYRPLTSAESPWPLTGLNGSSAPGIWMARDPKPVAKG